MGWPLSQDFNEAIQNPSSAFADADLKTGRVATTPLGVPMPRSGNYADVYQVTAADGRNWAVKCFTRPVAPDLQSRYAAIAGHLAQANLPFTVGFEFLAEGIRVKGRPYPALKMQWVEGFALNTFVKDNLGRASNLEAMLGLWVRLCRRLRETGMAHCDIQHGNVILVPGSNQNSLGLKLVDYDGMFVPALAGRPPGEAGHASFQHPQRIQINAYSADLDRFPHLVVATALRGLLVGGKSLWEKYDTGDNLLFTARDFTAAHQSKVMRELWDTGDPFTVGLLSHMAIACSKPLTQTPWLDALMPEGHAPVLTPSQERQAMQLLGVPVTGIVPSPLPAKSEPSPPLPATENAELGFDSVSRRRPVKKASPTALYAGIAAGVVAVIIIAVAAAAMGGGGKKPGSSETQAQGSTASRATPENTKPPASAVDPVKPPPVEPAPVEPNPMTAPPPAVKGGKLAWSTPTEAGRGIVAALDGSHFLVPFEKTGQVIAYDAKSGKAMGTFKDHAPQPEPVAVAPLPGGKALSAGSEPVMMVWNAATGKAEAKVTNRGPDGTPWALFTDPTGAYALVACGAQAALVDLEKNEKQYTIDLPGQGVAGVAGARLAPDGKSVLALTKENSFRIVGVPERGEDKLVPHKLLRAALVVAWSPERNLAVLQQRSEDGATILPDLHVLDTATGEVVKTLPQKGHCEFAAEGKYLVAASEKGAVWHDTATWTVLAEVPATLRPGTPLALSRDGTKAAAFEAAKLVLASADVPALTPAALPPPKVIAAKPPDPKTPAVPARKPVPTEAALKSAEQAVKDTYKDAFGKRGPGERKKLGELLLKVAADTTTNAPAKYWMLREVQAIATEVSDPHLGAKAIDLLDAEFDVDGMALRIAMLEKIGSTATSTSVLRGLAESCSEMVEEQADKNEFDKALKLISVALAALNRANLPTLGRDLEVRQAHIRRLKEAFEPVKLAYEALKKDPNDPAANLTLGRYRCFLQGHWAEGLACLAASSDESLKKLAALDLSTDAGTTEMKRADAWWDWSLTQQGLEKEAAQRRARIWYAKILASGKAGNFDREAAAARMAFTHEGVTYKPGLLLEMPSVPDKKKISKMVTRLVPTVNLVGTEHTKVGSHFEVTFTGFLVPPVSGRYKLTLEGKTLSTMRLFSRPEDKLLINVTDLKEPAASPKRETTLSLPVRPVALQIKAILFTGPVKDTMDAPTVLALKWQRPGGKEEPITADFFFHTKTSESSLTDK